ncbi:MAG: cytochrome c3 family protein [Planctomycetia bacterium]|nr:MAG: cytochrome c3 family protein [Planctomycetia bacterium]
MFQFPKWMNGLKSALAVGLLAGPAYAVVVVLYGFSPQATDVGYQPVQPIPYSHALHVGKLGIDCRYCHTTVEDAAHAAVPPTQTCMNCHSQIQGRDDRQTANIKKIIDSHTTGKPVHWIRVHDAADFVYFNHAAHINRGVGCVSCHGRVDQMEVVYQQEHLSMQWCLDCHRNPGPHLRPPEFVTKMDWAPDRDPARLASDLAEQYQINPSTDCSTCHR